MEKRSFAQNVKDEIYSPNSKYAGRFDPNRCAKSVHEGGRGVGFHQCTRKGTVELEGYKFCSKHANEIKLRYGVADVVATKFVASFYQGSPELASFTISEETDSYYHVSSINNILGYVSFYTGVQKKNSQWNRKFNFFDTEKDAWLWLQKQASESLEHRRTLLDNAIRIEKEISDLIENKVWEKRKKNASS